MVSQSGSVTILRESLEMFSLPVMRNVKEYKNILLDNALSLYNVCHRCLFPIPS